MAYTGPYPNTSIGSTSAVVVSNTTFSGSIGNSGTIGAGGFSVAHSSFGGIEANHTVSGGIQIDAASQLAGIGVGAAFFGGGISSAGTLSADISVGLVSTFLGGITNSGTISAVGASGEIYVDGGSTFSGGIVNSGALDQAATGIWLEYVPNSSGGITNTGTITDGRFGVRVSNRGAPISETFAGGISNGGTITSAGPGIVATNITQFGTSTNGGVTNTGMIKVTGTGSSYGIEVSASSFAGSISNSGTISDQHAFDAIIVSVASSFDGGFTNTGSISGVVDVTAGTCSDDFINGSSGKITGGFGCGVSTFAGDLINQGTVDQMSGGGVSWSGSIINSGSIVNVIASGGGIVAGISTWSGNISNSGTITADYGISLTMGRRFAAATIINTGIISGSTAAIDVSFYENAVIIDQASGSLSGAIRLSTSMADVLDVTGGEINGNIAGGSTDTVDFTLGAGNSFNYSDTISGGMTVDLTSGTLELGAGASIGGNLTFAGDSATLRIDGAASQISGNIAGFAANDAIDLSFVAFSAGEHTSWQQNGSTGTLSVLSSGGATLASLTLAGSYSASQFSVTSDNAVALGGALITLTNSSPPAGTTADMIMSNPGNGDYEIYNVGANRILAAYALGQVSAPWTFAAMGTFQAGDTGDMLLRNASTGQFEAYYINNNNITGSANVGTVGTNWNFAGTGDFDGHSSLSELLLRNSGNGAFELYQVAGGGVLSGSSVAAVGSNFTVEGFGHFSESSTTQMLMEGNSGGSLGQIELYTYDPGSAAFAGIDVGKVGSNLSFLGCADLLGNGSTQMVMQQSNGNLWLYTYDPSSNALSGTDVGAVGGNFHVVGFGPLGTAGQDEMLMQDAAGAFEVYRYNAGENAFDGGAMGAVGAPWVVDGIAGTNPPANGNAQLVQAMASMSGGTGISAPANLPAGPQTTGPTLLAAPHA